ncbi:hypothetical protein H6G93_09215 [Nostoc sp. FACHB-973]|nr:hypothetical protein [Nostoc sp. FACHB-973]
MNNRGFQFPLALDAARGGLKVVSGVEITKGDILSVLSTQKRERVMRPGYGINDPLFDSLQDVSQLAVEILQNLKEYVADAEFQTEGVINEDGECEITVYWSFQGDEQPQLTLIF